MNLLVCLLWGIKRRSLIKVMMCPIYVFPSNHIIYIYIITIIVYFIETYIYIIKTSHVYFKEVQMGWDFLENINGPD